MVRLSHKQREGARLLALGKPPKEIAEILGVTIETVYAWNVSDLFAQEVERLHRIREEALLRSP